MACRLISVSQSWQVKACVKVEKASLSVDEEKG